MPVVYRPATEIPRLASVSHRKASNEGLEGTPQESSSEHNLREKGLWARNEWAPACEPVRS